MAGGMNEGMLAALRPFKKRCSRESCLRCERPLCASAWVRGWWQRWWDDSGGAERREEMVEMVEVCNCEISGVLV